MVYNSPWLVGKRLLFIFNEERIISRCYFKTNKQIYTLFLFASVKDFQTKGSLLTYPKKFPAMPCTVTIAFMDRWLLTKSSLKYLSATYREDYDSSGQKNTYKPFLTFHDIQMLTQRKLSFKINPKLKTNFRSCSPSCRLKVWLKP
jgi:hypothetical protein